MIFMNRNILFAMALAVAVLAGCKDDKEHLSAVKGEGYVLQKGAGATAVFTPYMSVLCNKNLVGGSAAGEVVTLDGSVVAMRCYETKTDKTYPLAQVQGSFSTTVTDVDSESLTRQFSFSKQAGEILGDLTMNPADFTYQLLTEGSGDEEVKYDVFKAKFSPVTNATEYGFIFISESSGDYFRLWARRVALVPTQNGDGTQSLYFKTERWEFLESSSASWKVAVYAFDGDKLYVESDFKLLRYGAIAFS